MSCWVVDDAHISVLVAGMFEYGVVPADGDPRALGTLLLEENKASVSYDYEGRYDHEHADHVFGLTTTESPLHPVALLKAVDCYRYQSCEHPGWRDSAPCWLTLELLVAVLNRHPSLGGDAAERHPEEPAYKREPVYDTAPWRFTSIEQAHADRYPPVAA